jgi:hypothetical protein
MSDEDESTTTDASSDTSADTSQPSDGSQPSDSSQSTDGDPGASASSGDGASAAMDIAPPSLEEMLGSTLGLGDVIQVSGGSASFTSLSGLVSCSSQLAQVAETYLAAVGACGGALALILGELPSAGADTPATLGASAACVAAARRYIAACEALGTCLGSADAGRAATVQSFASNADTQLEQLASSVA